MTRYTVEIDGETVGTRNSKRDYSHAVVGRFVSRYDGSVAEDLKVVSMHSTEQAAQKAAATAAAPYTEVGGRGRRVTKSALYVDVAVVETVAEVVS